MRFKRAFSLMAIISLSGLFACDFFPGSRYQTRQTLRVWTPWDAQSEPVCRSVGAYRFTQDLEVPDWSARWRLSLRPEERQDRDNLPTQAWIQYDLNDQFFHQINFDLNRGRGSSQVRDQVGFSFNTDDILEMYLCFQDGFVPAETTVDYKENVRFLRIQQQF